MAIEVRLKPKERAVLEARLRAATTEQRQLLRIRIVLEAVDGHATREIARELDTTPTTVSLWRGRYARHGLDGLDDLPRSGTPATTERRPTSAFARCWASRRPKALPAGTDR
jgi:transposase